MDRSRSTAMVVVAVMTSMVKPGELFVDSEVVSGDGT